MTPRSIKMVGTICLLMATMCSAGCATFNLPFGKRIPTATAANPANQILCFWQPGEGNDPDGYPCRGFCGQILFLSSKTQAPVKIDGDVRVYLFDDQGTVDEQTKPLRQFDFDSGSWNIHLGETSLGPTYSIFIPYVRRGVTEANCSLRIRMKPSVGPTIFSDFSNIPLNPTKKIRRGEEAKPMEKEEVEQIGVDALTSVLKRTTTIQMGADGKLKNELPANATSAAKPKDNPIQQASHQVVTEQPKSNPEADRIRQLETMVQQLMEQKNSAAAPPSRLPQREAPEELERDEQPIEPLKPRRRFQVRGDSDITSAETSRRASHLLDDDDDAAASRTAVPAVRRSASRHPLDLDSDE